MAYAQAFVVNAFINAHVEEIAYSAMMEDRAAEELDGLDFGDRCYYGDRAYTEQRMLERYALAAADLHPILYA
ncbi:hypothetical protein CcrRB23_gp517 [Caulobacter phage RB23]|nr:hypothetical protein CcrRB23_gp022 [Caulobacter phage RB23]UTU10379.1 hypothetical protein CcrRB23_gp517 [Caulobacter phage RB23]